MSLKPICYKCQRFYRPEKNGIYFCEGMPIQEFAPPGTEYPNAWGPYKVWMGDLWKCHGCGHEIIVGVGQQPVSEHYKPGFERELAFTHGYQVNDC